jgi:hypothetical protein
MKKATTGMKRRTTEMHKEDSPDIVITSVQPLYVEIGTAKKHCVNCVI